MRHAVEGLAKRKYLEMFRNRADFVIMFVPSEACLSASFQHDPDLFEFAFQKRVLVVGPVTLFGLLKAVAVGWQQYQMVQNAKQIAEQGKEIYDRLNVFLDHLSKVGKNLEQEVQSYNNSIGSLESRLMPAARKLQELGSFEKQLPSLPSIHHHLREAPLPDLLPGKPEEPPGPSGAERRE
mgnify:CR=1 FL=1